MSTTLGRLVREAREAAGLTVAQLADMAGIDRPMIYRIEDEEVVGGADTQERLADALGIDPAEVLRAAAATTRARRAHRAEPEAA
ncbi:MAG TPA: helix-turn-helix transcriptional regulator [Phycisphaerales bacterium]|nr:helix-turn-helix transcriptional regulator [Phycisphaerales bacterium]